MNELPQTPCTCKSVHGDNQRCAWHGTEAMRAYHNQPKPPPPPDPEYHVIHEAADRLDHYLDTHEQSTPARIAGHQLTDELRKTANFFDGRDYD